MTTQTRADATIGYHEDHDGTWSLVKKVKTSNFLYSRGAWAISVKHLQAAIDHDCHRLILVDEQRNEYRIELADFIAHAERFQHPGYEPQFRCPDRYFRKTSPNQAEMEFAV